MLSSIPQSLSAPEYKKEFLYHYQQVTIDFLKYRAGRSNLNLANPLFRKQRNQDEICTNLETLTAPLLMVVMI